MQSMAPRAQGLLNNPTQQYQGQLVAPFSAESETGLQGLSQYAGQGMPGMRQGYNVLGRAMQGFDPGMMAMLRSAYGGGNPMSGNINAGQTTAGMDLIGRGGATNPGIGDIQGGRTQANDLRGIVSGVNPYLDPTFDRAANRMQNRVAAVMSQAGMSGSGAQQDLLQQGLGDLATQIYGGAYEADQSRRMGAASQLAGLEQSDLGRGLQAAGMRADIFGQDRNAAMQAGQTMAGLQQADLGRGLQAAGMRADLYGQDIARQLQAAGMLSDASRARNAQSMQAVGMLPGMYQAGQMPYQDMLRVGSARDTQAQNLINAERQQFEQGQLLPWQDLARYQAIINPMGQQFQTGSNQGTSTTTERQSPLQQILGAGMMASTLFGNPFGMQAGSAMMAR